MRSITWLLFLIFCFSGGFLYAQEPVVITHTDVPASIGLRYEKQVFKNGIQQVDVSSTGANQMWDFTSFDYPITEVWEVVAKESTPFAEDFPLANLVYKVTASNHDTVTYNFVRLTEEYLAELGQGKQLGTETTRLAKSYLMAAKAEFPVAATDEPWVSVPIYETTYEIAPGLVFTVLAHDSNYYEIDGWGIVKTPLGELECIRVKQIHQMDIYLKGSDNPLLPAYESYIVYSWVSPIYGFVATIKSKKGETEVNFSEAAEITVMSKFNPTAVRQDAGLAHTGCSLKLFDNYPNPFNPVTMISYDLPQASRVKLQIYNMQGQEVARLVDEYQAAGQYKAAWNGEFQPSGLYVYRLNAGGNIMQKKCTLLK
ncbi:T9SS type A sorting domain-containing protein [candidate division KSB1 bacterium]|nr:T9SS type A sorting domain-containing protein [candidate division KSB1 bacterium]